MERPIAPVLVQTLARSDCFLRQRLNAINAREPRQEETLMDSDCVFLCEVTMAHIRTARRQPMNYTGYGF